jgi:hypothetical protein
MPATLIAHEQPISKIFSNDYVFRIPEYQRPYAWTTEQARELLDDITDFMKSRPGKVEDMPWPVDSEVAVKLMTTMFVAIARGARDRRSGGQNATAQPLLPRGAFFAWQRRGQWRSNVSTDACDETLC